MEYNKDQRDVLLRTYGMFLRVGMPHEQAVSLLDELLESGLTLNGEGLAGVRKDVVEAVTDVAVVQSAYLRSTHSPRCQQKNHPHGVECHPSCASCYTESAH